MGTSLAPNAVHVWYRFTDQLDDRDLEAALSILSGDEHERHRRFLRAEDRRDYAVAHALLRNSLSRYGALEPAAWEFQSGTYGKPILVQRDAGMPALSLNLSHSRGLVACAVASGPEVGVDVERIDRAIDWSAIVTKYFAEAEIAQLDRSPRESRAIRFIEFWTLKEAYVKAIGSGLSEPLTSFWFDLQHGTQIRFTPPEQDKHADWQFALLAPAPQYRIGLAIKGGPRQTWQMLARSPDDAAETLPTHVSEGLMPF